MIVFRANVYGEKGFLGFQEFNTLYDAMEYASRHLLMGDAVEIVRIESCAFNAMKMKDGRIVQTDEDGFAYILKGK